MKTLVEAIESTTHAIIISNVYVKYIDSNTPVWNDEKSGLAETENCIGNVALYQVNDKGKVTRIEVSHHTILAIAAKIEEIKSAKTEPDFPEY